MAASDRCRLTAGVNRGREKLVEFGARFGVEALYHDHRRMLAESAPEICIVATHPELHCGMVEDCAAAPATRAIICEKPMALSLGECDRMIAACERAGVLLADQPQPALALRSGSRRRSWWMPAPSAG